MVFGSLLDAVKERQGGKGDICHGRECFSGGFGVAFGGCLLSLGLICAVLWRSEERRRRP
jgi:hypothetical protein